MRGLRTAAGFSNFSRRTAGVAAGLLLIIMGSAPAPAEAYPWEIFAAALSGSATATIESSADESDTDLATAVFRVKFQQSLTNYELSGLEELQDDLGRSVRDYPFQPSVLVWSSEIPATLRGIVHPGDLDNSFHEKATGQARIFNGMWPVSRCPSSVAWRTHTTPIGSLGWPCHNGGSVALAQRTSRGTLKNCMVLYGRSSVEGPQNQREDSSLERFKRVLTACCLQQQERLRQAPPQPVDLTELAQCIFNHYPDGMRAPAEPGRLKSGLRKAIGVAVIPGVSDVEGPPGVGVDLHAGVASPTGRLAVGVMPIQRQLDLNLPANDGLYVTCIALLG